MEVFHGLSTTARLWIVIGTKPRNPVIRSIYNIISFRFFS